MFYYLLGNISPRYRSRLKMIQLVHVINAEVMKEHGVDTILKPLISDIQKLEKVSNLFMIKHVQTWLEYTEEHKLSFWKRIRREYFPHAVHTVWIFVVYILQNLVQRWRAFLETCRNYTTSSVPVLHDGKFCRKLHVSLHLMSDTRWSARIDAVKPLVKRPRKILQALNKLQVSSLTNGCNLLSLFYWPLSGSKLYKQSMT